MLKREEWDARDVGDDVEAGLLPPSSASAAGGVEDGRRHVVIIGAGVGGVATAARLAKKHGYRVTVLEKNAFSGGRCSLIHTPEGFRFDQGPSLYLMPQSYKQTFDDLGVDIEDHLKLVKCDPNYRMFFDDGSHITLTSDMAQMQRELEKVEEGAFLGFLAYMKEAGVHYNDSVTKMLSKNFNAWWEFFHPKHLSMVWRLHVFNKLYQRTANFFSSSKLRQAFSFQTMYMGISPYDSPATFSLLSYTECTEGVWYPMGGMHSVVSALESIATQHGAQFHFGERGNVKEIVLDSKTNKVWGVLLQDGSYVKADAVVCNADAPWAYNNLLPATPYAKKVDQLEYTASTISFYWGLDCEVPQLSAHNIFLNGDYKKSFDDIFQNSGLPQHPSFYIHVPSRIDPSASPDRGKDAVTVLVPISCIKADRLQDWDKLTDYARKYVFNVFHTKFGFDIGQHIISERINTPLTWRDKFNLQHGAALGLSHNVTQIGWMRPSICHATYDNMFFVGASVHPGTGVPIVLHGAALVEDEVQHYLATGKKRKPSLFSSWVVLLYLLILLFLFYFVL